MTRPPHVCAALALTLACTGAASSGAPAPGASRGSGDAAHSARHIEGACEYHGRLIVRPRAHAFAAGSGLHDLIAGRVIAHHTRVNELVLSSPRDLDRLDGEIEALERTGLFRYVEPDWLLFPAGMTAAPIPDDPRYGESWQHPRLGSPDAWTLTVGDPSVVVAIVDTGVDLDHPDLAGNLVPGFHTPSNTAQTDGGPLDDPNGHGTFCAGLVAATGNNGTGVVGVGWTLSIMPVRVSDRSDGAAFTSEINQGARWAAENGADVVNVSYSGGTSSSAAETARFCEDLGALYVRAIGNSGANVSADNAEEVILVGATTPADELWGSSNYGSAMDLVAPGRAVRTTYNGGGYGGVDGTSFAAPLTAGVIGLIRSVNPALSPAEVRTLLFDTAEDIGETGEDLFFARGIVSSKAAVEAATLSATTPCVADFTGDLRVDLDDFGIFVVRFGSPACASTSCRQDLNADGEVDSDDFSIFASEFGRTDCR